jgi:hypothetical protein
MLELITAAFERQDYDTAAQLLQQLQQNSAAEPWVQFYLGRLDEISGNLDAAAEIYRQLLLSSGHVHAKIVAQARQGIERIEILVKAQRQEAIAQATADPDNTQKGVLVLEPIASDRKPEAARNLARIMQVDPYTARLQLPSRGWRLYRMGAIGELQFFGQQLLAADIPCFWVSFAEIEQIQIFHGQYFETASEASVVCQNKADELSFLSFQWLEVTHKAMGLLPIFEQVVDRNVRGKLQRKTQTQDYVQVCDLHLPSKSCILRLCDRSYMFHNGISFSEPQISKQQAHHQTTVRINWNHLQNFLDQKLYHAQVWSDFTVFAESALDRSDFLDPLPSHIHLFRREPSNWDPAFHLYSGLAYLKGLRGK